jgi:hypothetical protein
LLLAILAIVFVGGLVKGLAGFGYAIASTAILATVLDPATAVVIMIVPMIVANLVLVRELDREGLRSCIGRFWPYVLAALIGTLIGMAALDLIPTRPLTVGLGLFTLGYVLATQDRVRIPGRSRFVRACFRPGTSITVAVGFVSGTIFGASNVAVQIVAYLDGLSLDRPTFVGVLSMILVGVSSVRLGAAWYLGLFDASGLIFLSTIASIPGLAGVALGGRLRTRLPDAYLGVGVLALLAIIGVRLLSKGLLGI